MPVPKVSFVRRLDCIHCTQVNTYTYMYVHVYIHVHVHVYILTQSVHVQCTYNVCTFVTLIYRIYFDRTNA